jgi:hypothetical protein
MFRQLARLMDSSPPATSQAAAEKVLTTREIGDGGFIHPMQLSRFLEEVWANRNPNLPLATAGLEIPLVWPLGLERDSGLAEFVSNPKTYPPTVWDHLIYAYMVENTRIYEIFQRVLAEYAFGERLSIASQPGQRWLRTTEALFYRESPPFQIYALPSWIRTDIRAVRRNVYHRMFGLDLNHGTDDNRPYPYPRAAATNTGFVGTFEELLREVWRAIENVRNQVGPNQTDISTMANLARTLYDMLRARRRENVGNLARDELWHVSTLSWFHLTLEYDTPIVVDLNAEAPSPAERLQKIGERVGLPAHSRADSYFFLAQNMSLVLRELELGTFNTTLGVPALFQTGAFQDAMQQIITHWSIATGRDVKFRPVAIAATQPAPIRPMPRPPVAATNGQGVVPREAIPT